MGALVIQNQGKLEQALLFVTQAVQTLETQQQGTTKLASAYTAKGTILGAVGGNECLEAAMQNFDSAIQIFQNVAPMSLELARTYNGMAEILLQDKLEKALEIQTQAMKLYEIHNVLKSPRAIKTR